MNLAYRHSIYLYLIALISLGSSTASSQTFLYLEDMTQVRAIKIPVGSTISIKTTNNPNWTSYTISRLLDQDGVILHANGMIDIADITHLRRQRPWVKALAYSLQTFGVAWGLYGGIVLLANPSGTTLPIVVTWSVIPLALGYMMKKIWLYKKYKIGNKNRLKILDLSFPDDPYGVKDKRVKYHP